jgi:flagellar biosynthesis/type III secretory pathway chaperone
MVTNKQKNILDKLQNLLEQQIALVHKGNSAGGQFETLSSQADSLVREIAEMKILEREDMEDKRTKLRKSYNKLRLALIAQKDDIGDKLGQVRKGRKTIGTYRNNI